MSKDFRNFLLYLVLGLSMAVALQTTLGGLWKVLPLYIADTIYWPSVGLFLIGSFFTGFLMETGKDFIVFFTSFVIFNFVFGTRFPCGDCWHVIFIGPVVVLAAFVLLYLGSRFGDRHRAKIK